MEQANDENENNNNDNLNHAAAGELFVLQPEENVSDDDEAGADVPVDEEEDDDDEAPQPPGVIEGGVADEADDAVPKLSTEADLVSLQRPLQTLYQRMEWNDHRCELRLEMASDNQLFYPSNTVHTHHQYLFFECSDCFDHLYKTEAHPLLQPLTTVRIGLGKSTKLEKVMKHYVELCNERRRPDSYVLQFGDLDFIHVQLLNPNDTVDVAALMKEDIVKVTRNGTEQRQAQQERNRQQRISDKLFFDQLRGWLLDNPQGNDDTDVALLCRTKPSSHGVYSGKPKIMRCHECIVTLRCKWLGALISKAKHQQQLRDERIFQHQSEYSRSVSRASDRSEDDYAVLPAHARVDAVGPFPRDNNMEHIPVEAEAHIVNDDVEPMDLETLGAAKIENDEYENDAEFGWFLDERRTNVFVDFPRDVVRLLVEYIYTNRVFDFGHDAFAMACRTRPSERRLEGPVPPYDIDRKPLRRWPNKGLPLVSFEICIAAIKLGETASMPRFTLMAEVAASQHVTPQNVVEALVLCETQRHLSGNALPSLRKAAMNVVLRSRSLLTGQPFKDSLEAQGKSLVPPLLTGALDAIEADDSPEQQRKRADLNSDPNKWQQNAFGYFTAIDKREKKARDQERSKYRTDISKIPGRGMKRSARHFHVDGNVRAEAKAVVRRSRRGSAR
jgi:hypothetical protein